MRKIISGLKDLFDFDIVHRDLKLPNILLHFPADSDNELLNIILEGGNKVVDYELDTRR
jgi:serine/threonine protein kinase